VKGSKNLGGIYIQLINPIYRHLRHLGCSHEDAEDIVQDSFYKALLYLDGINPDRLSAWLFRVAVNRYYDQCRRQQNLPQVSIDCGPFLDRLTGDMEVEDIVLQREKVKTILETLNSINPTSRTLLLLKYDLDLSYREIAALMGLNEDTVKTYLYRARQQFRTRWEEY